MQLPFKAIALVLSDNDVPIGNATSVLFKQLGGALFIPWASIHAVHIRN